MGENVISIMYGNFVRHMLLAICGKECTNADMAAAYWGGF